MPGAAPPDVHGNFEYASQVLDRKRLPRRVVGDDVAIVDDDNAIRNTYRKIEIVENGQPLRPS